MDEEKQSEKESVEENGATVKSEQIVLADGSTTEQKVADSVEASENEKKEEEKEPELSAADKKEVCVTYVFITSKFISYV